MDTSLSEDTMAFLKRTNEIRMAKMCRLCLQEKSLVNINIDQSFRRVLTEGNAKFLPNDKNFPQFVCEDCRKVALVMFRFNQRRERSARLIRTYIERGGSYPDAKLLDDRSERSKKRALESDLVKSQDSKKARIVKDENGNNMKSKEDFDAARVVEEEKSSIKLKHNESRKMSGGKAKDSRSLYKDVLVKSVKRRLSQKSIV